MATPDSVTTTNISGVYLMDKKLSDSSIPVLKMQKIPWIVQQAVNYSTITVKLKQYTDDAGVVHVDQEQVSSVATQHEPRELNGVRGEREVQFWGKVKGYNKYTKLAEVDDEFLKEGWLDADGDFIESYTESATDTWTAKQVWGFAEIQGERRHCRRVVAKRPGSEDIKIRLVYAYQGEHA